MFRFLSAEVLYGLLLVTTFASVGLLGLWAATSRWHPFLRTTIVLAILSVLLLRPMFEPFVMLVSQVATIAAGVAAYRWLKNRKQANAADAKRTRYQFSLKTLLFVSTLVAMGAAVVAKLPVKPFGITWLPILANGFWAGIATILSVAPLSGRPAWWKPVLTLIGIAVGAYAVSESFYPFLKLSGLPIKPPISNHTGIIIGFGFLVTSSQLLVALFWKLGIVPDTQRNRRFWLTSSLVLFSILFAFPATMVWRLVNHLPPPPPNPMKPNAYSELMALGASIRQSSLGSAISADPIDMKRISSEVANHAAFYQQLDRLLTQPAAIPKPLDSWKADIAARRDIGRALVFRADVARESANNSDALAGYFDTLQFTRAFQGGITVDWMTSCAIEGMGVGGIYGLIDNLDASQCDIAIERLMSFDSSRESIDEVAFRDCQVDANAFGWMEHLIMMLYGRDEAEAKRTMHEALARSQAILRLLVTELALRKYQLAHNEYPDTLDQLVPDILSEVPRDPYDPAGGALRYKQTDDGYILYSVSQDGIDNGGVPPNDSELEPIELNFWWYEDGGDLRLDHYFAEPEPETTQDADVDLGESDAEEVTPEP